MSKRSVLCVLLLPFATAVALFSASTTYAASPQAAQTKTIWDGIYSEDQAKRGGAYYTAACAGCHRGDLSAYNGALVGEKFMNRWREDTLEKLFSNIKATMPRNNPGTLSDAVYVDILSFVLSANTMPAGSAELRPDTLKDIQFIGKAGPEALPAGALAQAYGCLTAGPDNSWLLTRATDFVRTRNPDSSSTEELQAAAAAPAGTHTYRMVDAAFFGPANKKDRKVEAKGFIMRGQMDGLSLTSMTPIAPACQ